jgi:hypothetical protein
VLVPTQEARGRSHEQARVREAGGEHETEESAEPRRVVLRHDEEEQSASGDEEERGDGPRRGERARAHDGPRHRERAALRAGRDAVVACRLDASCAPAIAVQDQLHAERDEDERGEAEQPREEVVHARTDAHAGRSMPVVTRP